MHDVGQQCKVKLSVLPTLVKTLCCAFAASNVCLQTLLAQENMLRNLVPNQHNLLVENLAVTELIVKMFQQEKHFLLR